MRLTIIDPTEQLPHQNLNPPEQSFCCNLTSVPSVQALKYTPVPDAKYPCNRSRYVQQSDCVRQVDAGGQWVATTLLGLGPNTGLQFQVSCSQGL